jgi:hypothetical protein
MTRIRNAAPWLLGILTASLLFALLFAFGSFQYTGSDDAPILRSFMGYEGGEPATFHLYLHTAFAWLLWGLAKLAPGVAWFSILQLLLLWLSQVVIVKSMAQLTRRRGYTVWPGALLGALFLTAYAVFVTGRISYTTTSALLGAAAVAQLASVDFGRLRRRGVTGPLIGSALLLLCAYCLRQISVLPLLCFWLLMLAAKLLLAFGKARRPWAAAKPVFAGVLATALLFGTFAAVREADIRLSNTRPLLDWQAERIQLLDYSDFDKTTKPETLQSIGWSDSEFTLFTYWYFLDDNMTTEALRTLNAQQTADDAGITLANRLNATLTTVQNALRGNAAIRYGLWAALAMGLAALALAAYRRERNPWAFLSIILAVLGGAALLGYLGFSGRLPMRAAASVLYPMAAFLWSGCLGAFLTRSLPPAAPVAQAAQGAAAQAEPTPPASPAANGPQPPASAAPHAAAQPTHAPAQPAPEPPAKPNPLLRVAALAVLVISMGVCAVYSLAACADMAQGVQPPPPNEEVTNSDMNMADLDSYALENPDTLFIYDLSQFGDHRLFPHTPVEGLAGNALFWGGYPARTPSWYGTFAKYGITALDATVFLADNVLLASTDPEPWPSLLAHIAETAGADVEWEYYDSYGYVNFYRIYTY